MKLIKANKTVQIPAGVTIEVKSRQVVVKGPRGTLKRDFRHTDVDMCLVDGKEGKELQVDCWFGKRRNLATIRTVCSHVLNMVTGVTKGYRYKMRLVYAHFPINAALDEKKKKWIELRNFLGEKRVRKIDMLEGVTIERSEKVKDEVCLEGNDLELVSRSAALVHQSCLVRHKDIRKFLDGVYVSEKGRVVEEKDN